jgi:hypothetical protein
MLRVNLAALICLGMLGAAGCAGGSTPTTATTPSPSSSSISTSAPPPTASNASSTSPESGVVEITVSVKDGKVSPKTRREKITKGSQVRLIVTSDVDDEVHVHGYEIEKEVSAGQPATLKFTADQTGLFEVETHESGLQLLQLEVK